MARERVGPPLVICQFKVTLKGIRPPIWRRFQAPNHITLYKLHLVLQEVMGWLNCHLYHFVIGGVEYGDPDPDFGDAEVNAKRVTLWQVLPEPKAKFLYEYDFGDGWQHEVVLEKVLPPAQGVRYPVCLGGAGACPPEDCGGPWGYRRMLEILSDPGHEEYQETVEWVGGGFDPEAFDLEDINWRLRQVRLK
ncbi:MAG: plasmid pRiA4b ORF-3 family protein [Moorellales bacterium]